MLQTPRVMHRLRTPTLTAELAVVRVMEEEVLCVKNAWTVGSVLPWRLPHSPPPADWDGPAITVLTAGSVPMTRTWRCRILKMSTATEPQH